MTELLALPIIGLAFIPLFSREVIAPASRNFCDLRWLVLSGLHMERTEQANFSREAGGA
ncbi:hypothetical protein [Pseudoduganella buxea]|uniref:Uncharacterized protein n=1 Tax=Pseudoduganella buxea TaxID=1949069 RepID=A0A6I3SY50_9BURK|nr:hypothetical protein [Pseudoduganella buxea]MTV53575.1 hypothetical protein [Pseudoduganella buxea]